MRQAATSAAFSFEVFSFQVSQQERNSFHLDTLPTGEDNWVARPSSHQFCIVWHKPSRDPFLEQTPLCRRTL
jgi:hypothetical protein